MKYDGLLLVCAGSAGRTSQLTMHTQPHSLTSVGFCICIQIWFHSTLSWSSQCITTGLTKTMVCKWYVLFDCGMVHVKELKGPLLLIENSSPIPSFLSGIS